MKHRIKTLWVAAILIGLAAQAAAQLATTSVVVRPNPRIGLGVALGKEVYEITDNGAVNQVDFPTFYVPVFIHPNLRLEPEIGFVRYSTTTGVSIIRNSILLTGCGAFIGHWCGPVYLYGGGRVAWIRNTHFVQSMIGAGKTTTLIDLMWGPALGGEYFFTPHLSLGGEIQFNFVKYKEYKITDYTADEPTGAVERLVKRTSARTKPLVFVRWYFGSCKE
jgi:hypothetical protein